MTSASGTGAAAQVEDFLKIAQNVFGLRSQPGRGNDNPHYMTMPLQLSNERLISDHTAPEDVWTVESPFSFLTGIPEGARRSYRGEPSAGVPSVSLLVGEYGLGKTELIFQLCEHLQNHSHRRAAAPLPVNLSMCRENADQVLRSTPDWKAFARLIFGPVLRQWPGLGDAFLEHELLPAVHRGEVMLVFDALDELAVNRDQHIHFFEGIRAFFDLAGQHVTRFRCLVSMRFEYISAVDTPSAEELVNALRKAPEPPSPLRVHFLHMDFLNDSWVQSYLRHTSTIESLVDGLQDYPKFYELLHRPIFLQMLRALDRSQVTFRISELNHPAQFVKAFVEAAGGLGDNGLEGPYFEERDTLVDKVGYMWDVERMARRTLAKYERTGVHITFEPGDIASFLKPVSGAAVNQPPDHETTMLSIHKCPFLHELSEHSVVFSHKVFLEYFVSRGIVLDLDESGDAFDRLVLNSDMRYFLKFLVQEKSGDPNEWYRRTVRSYALDKPGEWEISGGQRMEKILEPLDIIRRTLLDSMTEPRTFDSDLARRTIEDFFQYEDQNLHPRYLMYNYEAVAVYLWRHRWQEEDIWLRHDFSGRLAARALALRAELENDNIIDREGHELLAERIISIVRRLRLTEIPQMPLQNAVGAEDIKSRMKALPAPDPA